MSKAPNLSDTNPDPDDRTDPVELIEQDRELYERLAAADLSISDRLQAALEYVDQEGNDGE